MTRTQGPVLAQHRVKAAGGISDPHGSAELTVLHQEPSSSSVKNKTGTLETHQILPLADCYCPLCMSRIRELWCLPHRAPIAFHSPCSARKKPQNPETLAEGKLLLYFESKTQLNWETSASVLGSRESISKIWRGQGFPAAPRLHGVSFPLLPAKDVLLRAGCTAKPSPAIDKKGLKDEEQKYMVGLLK